MRQHTDFYLLCSPLIAAVTIQSSPSNFERLGDPWDTPMVLLELCSLTQRLTQENVALFSKKDPILVWLLTCLAKVSWGGIPTRTHVFWPNLNQPIQPIQACWPLRWQAKTLRGSEAARLTHQEIHANNLITELKSKGVKHDTDCWWIPVFC